MKLIIIAELLIRAIEELAELSRDLKDGAQEEELAVIDRRLETAVRNFRERRGR